MKHVLGWVVTFFLLLPIGGFAGESVYAPVKQIKHVNVTGKMINCVLICQVPNPCYQMQSVGQNIEGSRIKLKVMANRIGYGPCADMLGIIQVPVSIKVPRKGSYHLNGWISDTEQTDTIVVVGKPEKKKPK